jgi:hypothetical protein
LNYDVSTSSLFFRSGSCKSLSVLHYPVEEVKLAMIVALNAALSKGVKERLKQCFDHWQKCVTGECKYFEDNDR